ncbi:MAG: DUF177 domain-containing protein [Salibacteraceae bacterium]
MKVGQHDFQFDITETFFEAFEETTVSSTSEPIEKANIAVDVLLDKKQEMLTLDFSFSGQVFVNCDRCLDELNLKLDDQNRIIFKFGDEQFEDTDEIVILPESAYQLDLSQYVYETLILSLPLRRVHPEGDCDPDMVRHLQEGEEETKEAETPLADPRWAALANLNKKQSK